MLTFSRAALNCDDAPSSLKQRRPPAPRANRKQVTLTHIETGEARIFDSKAAACGFMGGSKTTMYRAFAGENNYVFKCWRISEEHVGKDLVPAQTPEKSKKVSPLARAGLSASALASGGGDPLSLVDDQINVFAEVDMADSSALIVKSTNVQDSLQLLDENRAEESISALARELAAVGASAGGGGGGQHGRQQRRRGAVPPKRKLGRARFTLAASAVLHQRLDTRV